MSVQITEATKHALYLTANAIAPDTLSECEDNEEFVSIFLDSDYVSIYGGVEAGNEMIDLIQKHGYGDVHYAVCQLWQWK